MMPIEYFVSLQTLVIKTMGFVNANVKYSENGDNNVGKIDPKGADDLILSFIYFDLQLSHEIKTTDRNFIKL